MEIKKKIVEILKSDDFGITADVSEETILADLPGWDSFKQLTLLMCIEKEMKIELSPNELGTISKIGDLVTIIEKK